VDYGTGVIRVRAYDDATQELMAAGELPNFGDRVTWSATTQFKGRRQFMILSSPFDLEIDRPGRRRPPRSATSAACARTVPGRPAGQGHRPRRAGPPDRLRHALQTEDPDRNTITLKLSRDLFAAYGLTAATR
jgi:hypothetical protein